MAHLTRRRSTMLGSRRAGVAAAAVVVGLQAFWLGAVPAGAAGGPWPVYHHDAARTGVADAGPGLSSPTQRWATPSLDGAVYAEPVVSGPIVVVVTENDTVYGLAATDGRVVWHRHLGTPAPLSRIHQLGFNCGNIDPLGITSTPVIDESRGEVFVAAEVRTADDNVAHQLFGLNVTNGQIMLPATSVDPPTLAPAGEQQRAALALGNGRVYVSYGGLAGDCGPYKGAVDTVTEDGLAPKSYIVPTPREGGIWGPSGPAISSNGDVYVSVGNGAQTDPSKFDGSDSVTQLSPTLDFKSIFAPSGWASDNAADLDLGSTGPELLQNGKVFQVGKRGDAYLLNASNLGGVGKQLGVTHLCTSFGGQAYAAPTIYVACTDGVRAVQVNAQNNGFNVLWQGPSAAAGPPILGGGLVWVVGNDHSMYGLDPSSGNTVSHFAIPASEHFVTPTVADGELIVGTGTTVEAFGPPAGPPTPQPVVASPQFGVPNQTDVFDVAGNGAVEVSWTQGSGRWNGPMPISGPGLAPVGARLAVSQQFGLAGQTDVLVVGNDGAARVLWVDGAGRWNGPMPISPTGQAPAGAGLAASQQFGIADQTDVFMVGNDGAARVVWVAGGGAWHGPLTISPTGLAPVGAWLAASQQFGIADQTDVFMVGNDGAARVVWVAGGGRWNGPLAISPTGLAPAGAGLAASAQFGVPNQTDVFVVGANGAVRVVWVVGAGRWSGPLAISPADTSPPGAALAASAQFGVPNQTDVFVVGGNGAVRVVWVVGAGRWGGPLAISPADMSPPGAGLAASARFGVADETDVFAVADDAVPEALTVHGAGQWSGPVVI